MDITAKQLFLRHVNKTSSCWIWTGSIHPTGYGQVRIKNKTKKAHRVSYELFNGDIRDGLHVLHSCDNPKCVNPEHLWLGTHKDNMQDKERKGRGNHILNHIGIARKITKQMVLEIRTKYKPRVYTMKTLSKEYSVSISLIQQILERKTWKYV